MHSAVWSLVQMERWFICVNKFFCFALKRYLISKKLGVHGTPSLRREFVDWMHVVQDTDQ
jgi:hypothetical protein